MQHEIVDAHDLLLPGGGLAEPGWARKPILRYNREQIRHPPKRFKEWLRPWTFSSSDFLPGQFF